MSDLRRGLARRSVVGLGWNVLFRGIIALGEVAALAVLARFLSPAELGLYAAVRAVLMLLTSISHLSVSAAIIQRPTLEERHLRVGFTLCVILAVVVTAAVWSLAPVIADLLNLSELVPIVRAGSVVFLFQGVSIVALAAATRALRFRWLAAMESCARGIGFVLLAPTLAWLGFGVWALVGALVAQHVFRAAVLLAGQPHPKRPMLERRAVAELLYFGSGFSVGRFFNDFANSADKLIAGRWLGAQMLGHYMLASRLMTVPATVAGQIIDRVLFPAMALVQNEPKRLTRAYRSSIAVCALLVLPASSTLAIVAPELVLVMFGAKWGEAVLPFQILALGMLFRTSSKMSDCLARGAGVVYARAWRQALFAGSVVLGCALGQLWGIAGVAIGVVLAMASHFLLMAQLSLRVTGMRWSEFAIAHYPAVALATAICASSWLLADWLRALEVPPSVLLLDVLLFAACEGLLLCWLLPSIFLGPDGRSMLGFLRAKRQVGAGTTSA